MRTKSACTIDANTFESEGKMVAGLYYHREGYAHRVWQ